LNALIQIETRYSIVFYVVDVGFSKQQAMRIGALEKIDKGSDNEKYFLS